jgi:hypothetical protein
MAYSGHATPETRLTSMDPGGYSIGIVEFQVNYLFEDHQEKV